MEPAAFTSASAPPAEHAPRSSGTGQRATRTRRIFAALADGMVVLAFLLPGIFHLGWEDFLDPHHHLGWTDTLLLWAWDLPPFAIRGVMIHYRGQTPGKWLAGIKIVRRDGSALTWQRWLTHRTLPFELGSMLPVVGGFVALVDFLWLFGKEKRCLHDIVADTMVVKA